MVPATKSPPIRLKGFLQGDDLLPIHRQDSDQGAEVEHGVQEQPRLVQAEQMSAEIQMTGAADGQEFSQPLDDAQHRGFQPTQWEPPSPVRWRACRRLTIEQVADGVHHFHKRGLFVKTTCQISFRVDQHGGGDRGEDP